MNFQVARGTSRSRSPSPGAHRAHRRRIRMLPGRRHATEIYAGSVLATLALTAVAGLVAAPDRPAPAPAPAQSPETYEFAAVSFSTGSITGATALILIGLIGGAAMVGMLFYSPRTPRDDTQPHHHRTPPTSRRRAASPPDAAAHRSPGKYDAAAAPESANRREVCVRPVTRRAHPARSSRPSSRIRRCSSTSSTDR